MKRAKKIAGYFLVVILLCMQIPMQASANRADSYDWNAYSSYYYYNQLSEEEQQIWDGFEELCEYYMNNEVDITGNYKFVKEGDCTKNELIEWLSNFSWIFNVSHPQYFFTNPRETTIGWSGQDAECELEFHPEMRDGASRMVKIKEFEERIKAWNAIIDECDTDYEKVLTMCRLICGEMTYDLDVTNSTNACNAICTKRTVCYGYALLFQMLCSYSDIDAICLTSPKLEGEEAHIWNRVRLDGTWYNIDLTWMDEEEVGISYDTFLKDTEYFDSLISHTIEDYWNQFDLPECTTDSGSYAQEKISYTIYENEQLPTPVINMVDNGAGYSVEIVAGNTDCDIYYTLDGSIPSYRNKCHQYSGVFEIGYDTQVRAIAVGDGMLDSEVVSTGLNTTCQITFDGNGGIVNTAEKTVVNGNNYGNLPQAERDGYVFTGWFTSPTMETEVVSSDIVNLMVDCTLYAGWKEEEIKGHIFNGTEQGVDWSVDESGELTISGTGDVYSGGEWRNYSELIKTATVNLSGTTNIDRAFYWFTNLEMLDMSGCDAATWESANEMLQGATALQQIKAPRNLSIDIELPNGKYVNSLNEEISVLPKNKSGSELVQNALNVSLKPLKKSCGMLEFSELIIDGTGEEDSISIYVKLNGETDANRLFWNLYLLDEENNILDVVLMGVSKSTAEEGGYVGTTVELLHDDYSDYEVREKDEKYTITFDSQGADVGGTASGEVMYQQDMPAIVVPQRNGYKFLGYFSDSDGDGVHYYDEKGLSLQKYNRINDITLYAHWAEESITYSGGVKGSVTVYGDAAEIVTVLLLDENEQEMSKVTLQGNSGEYEFQGLPQGEYRMLVQKIAHVTATYDVIVAENVVARNVKICLIGDVSGDGKLNALDQKKLYNHIAKKTLLTEYDFAVGDVNEDGKINALDQKIVYNHIAKKKLLW